MSDTTFFHNIKSVKIEGVKYRERAPDCPASYGVKITWEKVNGSTHDFHFTSEFNDDARPIELTVDGVPQ